MISKYILEQRKGRLGSWTKVKELESYQHSATIKHLEPDCEYGFRVKAKNSEGFSEAVELESSIKSSKPPGELSLISNQWFENCECPTFLSLYTQFRLLKIWIFLSYVYGFFFQRNHPDQLDLWRLMTLQKIKSNCHGSPQRVTEDPRLHHTLWRNVKPDTLAGSVWPDSRQARSVWTVITWSRVWTTSSVWQLKMRLESVLLWKQTNLSHQRVNLVCTCIQNAVI